MVCQKDFQGGVLTWVMRSPSKPSRVENLPALPDMEVENSSSGMLIQHVSL
ncbi:hypothetical protein DPMN_078493 [Dreissena polymorpha]|uniref:Uncharacterized protein n=1 Tax=Dreissena polymorpha TaxID=45954 RepID=A0A9D4BS70_DREPO|nr:hypothetical protein DPMN_078493 [Dreissena polymorpha]